MVTLLILTKNFESVRNLQEFRVSFRFSCVVEQHKITSIFNQTLQVLNNPIFALHVLGWVTKQDNKQKLVVQSNAN